MKTIIFIILGVLLFIAFLLIVIIRLLAMILDKIPAFGDFKDAILSLRR
jgi:hypothetical protein